MNHKAWIATAAAALLTTQTYAEEVRFQFSATIDWIAEYDKDRGVNTFVTASTSQVRPSRRAMRCEARSISTPTRR